MMIWFDIDLKIIELLLKSVTFNIEHHVCETNLKDIFHLK